MSRVEAQELGGALVATEPEDGGDRDRDPLPYLSTRCACSLTDHVYSRLRVPSPLPYLFRIPVPYLSPPRSTDPLGPYPGPGPGPSPGPQVQ